MTDSLNVIALISGGKDSFYSILHCLHNGHKVVALGNLYPPPPSPSSAAATSAAVPEDEGNGYEETDLNSWMYQTVGHTVIPLYSRALGLPLYRQVITGTAVNSNLDYHPTSAQTETKDETEDLTNLLKTIIAAHPQANAVSTGAILSTYQRTRVESVATRLGLTPLSYLWQYPKLPPCIPSSLLQDMQSVGLDARIIKVASGGLDEGFLWENAASVKGMTRIGKAVARFGSEDDGAVLGEGGEFETLVIDGPRSLFKGRIVVEDEDKKVVREGGGSAWLSIRKATVEMKSDDDDSHTVKVPVPFYLDERFLAALKKLRQDVPPMEGEVIDFSQLQDRRNDCPPTSSHTKASRWTFVSKIKHASINLEADDIMSQIARALEAHQLKSSDITSTFIILHNMSDFATINTIYSRLFQHPNPPSRVTISCGEALHSGQTMLLHLNVCSSSAASKYRKALHVQSRSYWAPANIGPYSQAQSFPVGVSDEVTDSGKPRLCQVSVAGQIPLRAGSMDFFALDYMDVEDLPEHGNVDLYCFEMDTVLSLLHLHRIALEMEVSYIAGAVAYIPQKSKLSIHQRLPVTSRAWKSIYGRPMSINGLEDDEDEDEDRDLWEERHHGTLVQHSSGTFKTPLPDWSQITYQEGLQDSAPPMFVAEVESLPRNASVEWQSLAAFTSADISLSTRIIPGSKDGKLPTIKVHECTANRSHVQKIYRIYAEELDGNQDLTASMTAQLETLNLEKDHQYPVMAWVNTSVSSAWNYISSDVATVPCYKLWDDEGSELAVVLQSSSS